VPISVKRVYEPPSSRDGMRILVDRLWPRGLTKEQAALDEWLRDLAPSHELRLWYHSHEDQWQSFRKRYLEELARPEAQVALRRLYLLARRRTRLTLLFASKNEERNNAVALKELLEGRRKPPTGTGPAAMHATRKHRLAARRG
jgi:uncharacterized protein YeaO (DUF488 family)